MRSTTVLRLAVVALVLGTGLTLPEATRAQGVEPTQVPPVPECFVALEADPTLPVARIERPKEALQLTLGTPAETVYVHRFEAFPLAAGEVYQVVRRERSLRHPDTGEELGNALTIRGTVEIVEVSGGRAMARIRSACWEMEPGDLLRPLPAESPRRFAELPPFQGRRLIEPDEEDATVVLGLPVSTSVASGSSEVSTSSQITYGTGHVVTVDRGRDAGWRIGDVVLIYDPEPTHQLGADPERRFPDVVGRAVVFQVTRGGSTMIVADAVRSVEIGHRARRIASTEVR